MPTLGGDDVLVLTYPLALLAVTLSMEPRVLLTRVKVGPVTWAYGSILRVLYMWSRAYKFPALPLGLTMACWMCLGTWTGERTLYSRLLWRF